MARKYINEIQPYRGTAKVESNCNCITFVNSGNSQCNVNGYPLEAGNTLVFSGLEGEMDTTLYSVFFTGGTTDLLFVFRKKYT